MNKFLRAGRAMAVGQSDKVTQLHSDKDLSSRSMIENKRLLCRRIDLSVPLRSNRGDVLVRGWRLPSAYSLWPTAITMIFCVLFSWLSVTPVLGQEAKGLKKPNALQIGDKIPEELWNMPLQVVNNTDKIKAITLSGYRGKLIILDFWGTYCGACIAAFPKLDTLQQKYRDEVVMLSISTENKARVSEFVKTSGAQTPHLTFIAEGRGLDDYFKYGTLPHYIWIDSHGVIRSTSESLQVNASNIDEALKGKFNFRAKIDHFVEYDFDRSLLQNIGHDESTQVYFSSMLMPYQRGLKSMRKISDVEDEGRKITLLNVPLFWLYITAYSTKEQGFWKSNTIIEVKEHEKIVKRGTPGQRYTDWLAAGNGYCYEQIVRHDVRDSCFKYMQVDLDRMFPQYKAAVEPREIPCYIVKIADEKKYLKSITKSSAEPISYGSTDSTFRGTNIFVDVLVGNINDSERIDYNLYNETGRNDQISITIPNPQINLSLTNQYLSKYGLTISFEKRVKSFLIIKDRTAI